MSDTRQLYLKPDDLADELEKCQAQGNEPTVRFCEMILEMANRFYRQPSYSRYSYHDREDMAMYALERCIKGIKSYKPQYRKSCFAYYTKAIENASRDWLMRNYYRPLNVRRAATRRYAEELAQSNPQAAHEILDGILEGDTTGQLDDSIKKRYSGKRKRND